MVLFFSTTLLVAIAGLVSLLVIKRWELETGRVLLGGARPWMGAVSHKGLVWVERVLPSLFVSYAHRSARRATVLAQRSAARSILLAEHGLEHTLKSIRRATEHPRSNKEASMFLREVAEHKRQLLESQEPREIHEQL